MTKTPVILTEHIVSGDLFTVQGIQSVIQDTGFLVFRHPNY